jgi:16S rRNA (cytidine1402-2'-O)-methyltransferase
VSGLGRLILIPTPIDEESQLEQSAFELLEQAAASEHAVIVVEELKVCRRRWLKWGLPRSVVDSMVTLNEHTTKQVTEELLVKCQQGDDLYLMSDGGLPAFCDPGQQLVSRCHDRGVAVTATYFPNSVILALALSGFDHRRFIFEGFLPRTSDQRQLAVKQVVRNRMTTILMDTPYRMERLLKELAEVMQKEGINRRVFLAMDLNSSTEELQRGYPAKVMKRIKSFKREFVLVVE